MRPVNRQPYSDEHLVYQSGLPNDAAYPYALYNGPRRRRAQLAEPVTINAGRAPYQNSPSSVHPERRVLPFDSALRGNPAPPKRPQTRSVDPIPRIEFGTRDKTNAIVLHQTAGSTADVAIQWFRENPLRTGTPYVIEKDGVIYQTTDPDIRTRHVGQIKSRQGTRLTDPRQIHAAEKRKAYGDRWPVNEDSVGIEVVGQYQGDPLGWEQPTADQQRSVRELVDWLQYRYGLDADDVYKHHEVSIRKGTEGDGMGYD